MVRVKNSLSLVSEKWYEKYKNGWTPGYAEDIWGRLEKNVLIHLGNRPIGGIKPLELLDVLRKITARGALEQAHRVMQICSAVFRYAVATERAEGSPRFLFVQANSGGRSGVNSKWKKPSGAFPANA